VDLLNKYYKGMIFRVIYFAILVCSLVLAGSAIAADDFDIFDKAFDDSPVRQPVEEPDWFKLSFLEIKSDIEEARENKKRGLIIYFGQKHCPYCKKFIEDNFGKKDIRVYSQEKFDILSINVRGSRTVTDIDGKPLPEREFAIKYKANFTPTLIYFDTDGKIALKLVGYQEPYRFRASLEYVADAHYKKEKFGAYLKRAVRDDSLKKGEMNKQKFIALPPYRLARNKQPAKKPLLVMFEQSDCHACDVLHTGPLKAAKTLSKLAKVNTVQLNMWADTPVVTPGGKKMTAKQWAEKLDVNYAPTLIFFDKDGKEIIRSASVIHFYRLNNVLQYVIEDGRSKYGSYRAWRSRDDSKNNKTENKKTKNENKNEKKPGKPVKSTSTGSTSKDG
jgi:thioredoxin-related protein